ncbi:MAG: hypothetical protein U0Q18_35870 [Bryobacteraceae bacterium]
MAHALACRRELQLVLAVASTVFAQSHAGQPVPQYVTGDECLFCHRVKIADTWEQNPHARTVHPRDPAETESILGARPPYRTLKPHGYGKFDLLSKDGKTWDAETFALRCAGCHTTAVDPQTHEFSTASLDCYTCHGVVPQNHPTDTSLVWFSKKHERNPKLIVSICGQCHLRGGKSKMSGLPYPDNFVPGDDLFVDFQVDLADAENSGLNAGDRHVLENVRDVLTNGTGVTCIDCHKVHGDSSAKHRFVLTGTICLGCHNAEGPKKSVKKYEVHSGLCEY